MAYRKRALALNNHRLLLGAYEDVEQQNEFDLLQIVEDLLGGYGKTAQQVGRPARRRA